MIPKEYLKLATFVEVLAILAKPCEARARQGIIERGTTVPPNFLRKEGKCECILFLALNKLPCLRQARQDTFDQIKTSAKLQLDQARNPGVFKNESNRLGLERGG